MKESIILRSIMDYLAAKHIYAIRLNSGVQFGEHKGKHWAIRMAAPGTADILALLPCYDCNRGFIPCWIEVKNEKGVQSDLQKSFELDVEMRGHRYYICRSIEDVMEAIAI